MEVFGNVEKDPVLVTMARASLFLTKARVKDGVKMVSYLTLLIAGISIFVLDEIQEYNQGATRFNAVRVPLTYLDLPTITICFEYIYENLLLMDDYEIVLKIEHHQILIPGENKFMLDGGKISLILKELEILPILVDKKCIKISEEGTI